MTGPAVSTLITQLQAQRASSTYEPVVAIYDSLIAALQELDAASGTVTSVGLTMPGVLFDAVVPGSPVTTAGTLAPTLKTQTANTVLAGPTTAPPAAPTFRALTSADLPAGTGTVTSVGITFGGNQATQWDTSGSPVTTSGNIILTMQNQAANIVLAGPSTGSASNPTFRSLVAADINGLSPTFGLLTLKGADASNGNAISGVNNASTELAYLSLGRNYNLASAGEVALATSAAKDVILGTANTRAVTVSGTDQSVKLEKALIVGGGVSETNGLTVHAAAPTGGGIAVFSNGTDNNIILKVSDAGAGTPFAGVSWLQGYYSWTQNGVELGRWGATTGGLRVNATASIGGERMTVVNSGTAASLTLKGDNENAQILQVINAGTDSAGHTPKLVEFYTGAGVTDRGGVYFDGSTGLLVYATTSGQTAKWRHEKQRDLRAIAQGIELFDAKSKRNPGSPFLGAFAEQLAALYPEAVIAAPEELPKVDYSRLAPLALWAAQDLYAKMQRLEARLAALEGAP